jgi:hypothetical protein
MSTAVGTNNYFDASKMLKSEFAPVYAQWAESLAALASFQSAAVMGSAPSKFSFTSQFHTCECTKLMRFLVPIFHLFTLSK